MKNSEIGQRIAEERERRGFNQSELGRRLAVSPQAVQKWESGGSKPKFERLKQIADVLDIPFNQLVAGTEFEVDRTPISFEEPNSLASRLRKAFQLRPELNQAGLARACEIAPPSVTDWLSGATKKLEGANLLMAAQYLQINPWWLATGKGSMEPDSESAKLMQVVTGHKAQEDDRFVPVRTVKLKLEAGVNGIALDRAEEDGPPLYMPSDVVRRNGYQPQDLLAVRVRGGSMETTLFDGDTVVIHLIDKVIKDNQVYAINYEGEDVVKRLVRDNGEWWLVSDNPDKRRYPQKLCRGASCIIIGRIVYKQSENI